MSTYGRRTWPPFILAVRDITYFYLLACAAVVLAPEPGAAAESALTVAAPAATGAPALPSSGPYGEIMPITNFMFNRSWF